MKIQKFSTSTPKLMKIWKYFLFCQLFVKVVNWWEFVNIFWRKHWWCARLVWCPNWMECCSGSAQKKYFALINPTCQRFTSQRCKDAATAMQRRPNLATTLISILLNVMGETRSLRTMPTGGCAKEWRDSRLSKPTIVKFVRRVLAAKTPWWSRAQSRRFVCDCVRFF